MTTWHLTDLADMTDIPDIPEMTDLALLANATDLAYLADVTDLADMADLTTKFKSDCIWGTHPFSWDAIASKNNFQ